MRAGIAMIELIFAIVIIAISILTIPSVIHVAGSASNILLNQENVVFELTRVANDKFQSRWDGNYTNMNSFPLRLNPDTGDLNCTASLGTSRVGYAIGSSTLICNQTGGIPSQILNLGDGNVSRGIEQLNGGTEKIRITNTSYDINASYRVSYVNSALTATNDNNVSTTWTLGSVSNPSPNENLANPTHLKRVVIVFREQGGTQAVLSFFKSNIGN